MNIPSHISAFGNAKEQGFSTVLTNGSGNPNIASKMNVPDRIIVAGANKLMEGRPEVAEAIADTLASETLKQALSAPPTTLTVDHILTSEADGDINRERNNSSRANSISQSSNYFGEDEAAELRMQLVQLSSRVDELQRNISITKTFNFLSLSASAIALIFSFLLFLKKSL